MWKIFPLVPSENIKTCLSLHIFWGKCVYFSIIEWWNSQLCLFDILSTSNKLIVDFITDAVVKYVLLPGAVLVTVLEFILPNIPKRQCPKWNPESHQKVIITRHGATFIGKTGIWSLWKRTQHHNSSLVQNWQRHPWITQSIWQPSLFKMQNIA